MHFHGFLTMNRYSTKKLIFVVFMIALFFLAVEAIISIYGEQEHSEKASKKNNVEDVDVKKFPISSEGQKRRIQVLLIRHGESKHNIESCSVRDPRLTERGVAFAKEEVRKGIFRNPDVVYFSPMRRCIQTMLIVFGEADKFIVDSNLQERFPGELNCDTGSDVDYLNNEFPNLDFENLQKSWFKPENSFEKRVELFLGRLRKYCERNKFVRRVAVVTHDSVVTQITGKRQMNCGIVEYYVIV